MRSRVNVRKWDKRKKTFALTLFSLPALLMLLVFNYLPMSGAVIAFMNVRFDIPLFQNKLIGFKNFEFIFTSNDAVRIIRNTFFLNAAFIICGTATALLLAILLNEITSRKRVRLYQTVMFFPYFLSWVVVSYILYAFIAENLGIFNVVLKDWGLLPIRWYSSPKYWPSIFIIANIWKFAGYNSIVYYGGIMGISPDYYEAAQIDGASKLRMVWSITLPFLRPLITIMCLFAIGRIFYADFGMFYFLPANIGLLYPVTDVIDTYVYRAMAVTGDFGLAGAAALFQSTVGFTLILVTNLVIRRVNPESSLF